MESVEEIDLEKTYELENSWELSFKGKTMHKKQQTSKEWMLNYEIVYGDINTIELFWRVFNNVKNWVELHTGSIYAFFKTGIKPSWEDPHNCKGCSYVMYLNRNHMSETEMGEIFYHILCFLVGNETNYHPFLNGVTFERKWQGDKITFWCNAHSQEMFDTILEKCLKSKNDYTLSQNPANDNYKIVIKIVDHQEELKKIKNN